ncbi:unnamed protein product, partial [Effrenium voratum]
AALFGALLANVPDPALRSQFERFLTYWSRRKEKQSPSSPSSSSRSRANRSLAETLEALMSRLREEQTE